MLLEEDNDDDDVDEGGGEEEGGIWGFGLGRLWLVSNNKHLKYHRNLSPHSHTLAG